MNPLPLLGLIAVIVAGGVLLFSSLRGEGRGDEPDCESYSFDREEWRYSGIDDDTREHEAEAMVECGALEGKTRAEVTAMLGPHDTRPSTSTPRKWWFYAGWVNDGYGLGDGQTLYVHFDRSGKVRRATLALPQ